MKALKAQTYRIVNADNDKYLPSQLFDRFITTLIILNIIAIILESYQNIHRAYPRAFRLFEYFSIAIFTFEYLAHLWTASLKYKKHNSVTARLKFIFSPSGIVDILAILPFYLPFLISMDLRFLRGLRLMRLLRILKLNRYSKSMQTVTYVLWQKRTDIGVTFFVTFILMVIAAALMFHIEHVAQPEVFRNIFDSFWWAVATLTTVGYGDIYPITAWGKFFSAVIALLGIGMVALPTGIISSAFMEHMENRAKEKAQKQTRKAAQKNCTYCPHCGEKLPVLNPDEDPKPSITKKQTAEQ
ncbi:MAG: ion transporter [Cytophagales bacterium]|nr:ion transporter [Cytophagales bacterium]